MEEFGQVAQVYYAFCGQTYIAYFSCAQLCIDYNQEKKEKKCFAAPNMDEH
jgi:hypothetical protein